jgi:hypothetical protein
MSRFILTILKVTMLCALFATSTSVAQQNRQIFVNTGDTLAQSRDPVNGDIRTNSLIALFIRLEISGDIATPHDMQLTRIPASRADFSEDPSRIVFHAYDQNNELVGRTSVADRRMNAQDGKTVILDNRTVSIIVPLLAKPDKIAITVPMTTTPQEFSVTSVVRDFCNSYAADPICSDDPPQSNPRYGLLRSPALIANP